MNKKVWGLIFFVVTILFFGSLKPNSFRFVSADDESISIELIDFTSINHYNLPPFFDLTATISGVDPILFSGSDIVWFLNNQTQPITDGANYTITHDTVLSTLRVYYGAFEHINSNTTWTITASIDSGPTASLEIDFIGGAQTSIMIDSGNFTQEFSESPSSFFMTAKNIDGTDLPLGTTVRWYKKFFLSNKYEEVVSATSSEYTFIPTVGEHVFIARVGSISPFIFSNPTTFFLEYSPITSQSQLALNSVLTEESSSGLNSYRFTLINLTDENDVNNIFWYIEGRTQPVQYGGLIFDFKPTNYGVYRIVAKYDTGSSLISGPSYPVSITIDRTAEVLMWGGICVGIIAIVTVILIVLNVRKERIW